MKNEPNELIPDQAVKQDAAEAQTQKSTPEKTVLDQTGETSSSAKVAAKWVAEVAPGLVIDVPTPIPEHF